MSEELENRLTEEELECARLIALGRTNREIADRLGRSEAWVRSRRKDPRVMEFVNEALDEVEEAIKNSIKDKAMEAFGVICSLLEADNETVRLNAAKDILDRAGISKVEKKKIDHTLNVADMSNEDIMKRLMELQGE